MNLGETLRYLGYKGQTADCQILSLAETCWRELEEAADRRACWQEYGLVFLPGGEIDMECLRVKSRALLKNLEGCERAALFAATLGVRVDRLIRRCCHLRMSKAVVMQAAAAAMLEDYCDEVNEKLRREYQGQGWYLRPRFSPGYGDFPLECQPGLLRGLEAGRRVGITLTDSLLMVPSKSVTAVIGLSRHEARCTRTGCEACARTDCGYRKET